MKKIIFLLLILTAMMGSAALLANGTGETPTGCEAVNDTGGSDNNSNNTDTDTNNSSSKDAGEK